MRLALPLVEVKKHSNALTMHDPAVSVLTPVYNADATLARAVASVRAQSFADWQLILSDDASTDGSWALAQELAAGDPRIRAIRADVNGGAARARNAALAQAQGRYIAFLDADDAWLPDKLDRQIAAMQAQGAALSYTGYWRVRPDGARREVRVPATVDHAGLLRGNVIGCLTAVYDSAALGKIPMPDIRRRQDYGLWLQILRRIPRAHGLSEPLALYHQSATSLSSSKLAAQRDTWRLYREVEGLSRAQAASCLAQHLWQRLRSAP